MYEASLLAWSETGQLQSRGPDGGWHQPCQLPLVVLEQLIVSKTGILVVGGIDSTRGAVLLTSDKCTVLRRWDLNNTAAELVVGREGPRIITDQGTARLLPTGQIEPIAPHAKGAINRARMGRLHWLEFPGGVVLCHNRDLTMRSGAPGWCALQELGGWQDMGQWDDAMMCAGLLLVREGVDAKRVRWTARRPESGAVVARTTIPRGLVQCVDDRFLLAADTSLRVIEVATLSTRWSARAADKPLDTLTALPREFVYTSGQSSALQSLARPDESCLKLSPRDGN